MICILGEKMAHKKEKIKMYLFELSCLSCFDNSWLLVRSSRFYSSQNFNIFKFFFLGGGWVFIPINRVGGKIIGTCIGKEN